MKESKHSKKSYTKKICSTTKAITEYTKSDSSNKIIAKHLTNNKDEQADKNTTDYLDAMVFVAIIEQATESQDFRRIKQALKSHPSKK